jgi:hypothetical protein
MPGELQSVYVARNEAEAQQTQAFLESQGIRSVRRYRTAPARLFGLTLRGREIVEILVDEADAPEARALLAEADAGAFRLEDNEP